MSNVKSAVSSGYIQACLDMHGDLRYKPAYERAGLVVGANLNGPANIGRIIARSLYDYHICTVDKTTGDASNSEFVEQILPITHTYDTLVCCQGTTHLDWIEHQEPTDIYRQVHDSLVSHMLLVSRFVKTTIGAPYRKCIILIGSMAYRNVLNGSSVYCAAKAGLNMFGRCIAWELAPKGYDVYILHPGNVGNSPMAKQTIAELQRYRSMDEESAREYWDTGNPRNTVLTAEEIAEIVRILASGKYQYMAGNPIDLTGGQR